MILKSLPDVIHPEETTNAAFATLSGKELANGLDYSIVSQQLQYREGFNYEGTSMVPDIFMKNTEEEIKNGQAKILEAASEAPDQNR